MGWDGLGIIGWKGKGLGLITFLDLFFKGYFGSFLNEEDFFPWIFGARW